MLFRSALRHGRQVTLALRGRSEQRNRAGPQALHGEDEISEPAVCGQDFPRQAEPANIECPARRFDHARREKARRAEPTGNLQAGGIERLVALVVVRDETAQALCGETAQATRKVAVRFGEEWPLEPLEMTVVQRIPSPMMDRACRPSAASSAACVTGHSFTCRASVKATPSSAGASA